VTNERVERYNAALKGETTVTFDQRDGYITDVASFCMVTETRVDEKTVLYHGSCFDYYHDTYCHHAAMFRYKKQLGSMGKSVPDHRKGNNPYRKGFSANTPRSKLRQQYRTVGNHIIDIQSTFLLNRSNAPAAFREVVGGFRNTHTLVNDLTRLALPTIHKKTEIIDRALIVSLDLKRAIDISDNEQNGMSLARELNSLLSRL